MRKKRKKMKFRNRKRKKKRKKKRIKGFFNSFPLICGSISIGV